MPPSLHGERDYAFGQRMLTLRTNIGVTQEGLAKLLGITRKAVGRWEAGETYPKAAHLQTILALALQQRAFPDGQEEEEVRAFWRAAHQKVLLDEAWLHDLLTSARPIQPAPPAEIPVAQVVEESASLSHMDWVGALDVSHFAGREVEVAELTQWIVQERCRMVTLLGIGGVGKSTLASFLGQRLAPQFEAVLWRSVRDAPSCEDLIADCITFFSETPPASFPASLEQRINQLLARLQERRCLLVLDNLETLLEGRDRKGGYLLGYEGYGRLIQRLGESAHQSCVLLTSREKPKELDPLEGERGPVRALRLSGVDTLAAQDLLASKGLSGAPDAWQRLVESYAGNPLALKIVGQAINDLFGGDIERFLLEGELIFNGIRAVLRQQVARLTLLEHLLLTWLAVLREWTSLETLMQVVHPRVRRAQMLEALESLVRRSLLEQGQQGYFGLQSVVMEYLIDELGEQFSQEIVRGEPQQVCRVALEQGQAKDYIRQAQVRLLVQPLLSRLRLELGAEALVEAHLLGLLEQFRGKDASTQGYGPANVVTLLKALRGHLRGQNLSQLFIRGAYLQEVEMQDSNLAEATLSEVVFTEALEVVLAVAVSPDGRYFAAGNNNGQVRVWHEEGWVAHLTTRGHTDRVNALAFSPDSHSLVTASWDGTIRLWDLDSSALIWTSSGQSTPFTVLAMSPDGKLLSGSHDGALRLWDLRTGTQLSSLPTQGGPIWALAWSADGRVAASSSADGAVIRLWDTEQGTLLQELQGHTGLVSALAFAPDTNLLASGSFDQTVKLWNVEVGACLTTLEGHTGLVAGLAWSPDGHILASTSYDATIRLWNARTWQCYHILQGHTGAVLSLAFLPGGERLLSGGFDRTIHAWEVVSGQHLRTMHGYALALTALSWKPDGRFAVSASSEATLTIWDVTTRTPVQVLRGHKQQVHAVAWSPIGTRIASGALDQLVRIWDVQTGTCTHILQGHTGPVVKADWSPDGRWLATGSYDRSVRLWDLQEGTNRILSDHTGPVSAVMWSPDGALVASASEDGLVLVRRVSDNDLLQQFKLAGTVGALCWSPNGEYLVIGGTEEEQGVVSIREVVQGRQVHSLAGHRGFIMSLDWSAAPNLLVSAGADGTMRWWDPERGVCLASVQAHEAWIRAVRISPDGQTMVSCGEDGVIQFWEMQSQRHLATLRAERPYERLNIRQTSGLTNAQQMALRSLGAISADDEPPSGQLMITGV